MTDIYGAAEIVAVAPDRADWLALRQCGIGGSEVAAICGLDSYESPVSLWAAKTRKVVPEDLDSEAARWGVRLEDLVATEGAAVLGIEVAGGDGTLLRHPEHPHMIGTPDRIGFLDGIPGVVEVKTTSAYLAEDWTDGAIPDRAALQLHHYLAITGHRIGWIVALIGGQRLEVRTVEVNDDLVAHLIAVEADFWHAVETETMPAPLDGSEATTDALTALYAEINHGGAVELDDSTHADLVHLRQVKREIKRMEGEKDRLANEVRAAIGTAEIATYAGEKVASWKQSKAPSRFDRDRLRDEQPEVHAAYSYEGKPARPLLTPEPKETA